MSVVTRTHVLKIIKKFKKHEDSCVKENSHKRGPHPCYDVYYLGKRVVFVGLSKEKRKDKPHDHIPGEIGLSPHDTVQFAQCNISVPEWFELHVRNTRSP